MATVCDKFRQNFKRTFIEEVVSMFNDLSSDKWFISIGKPLPWISETGEEDSFPPASVDDNVTEIDFWQNLMAHKRVVRDDISIVIPRYDWVLGQVYQPYRADIELFELDPTTGNPYAFYVLVDEERVYKCIDNNYNAPSVISPTHTDAGIKVLSDGYRWKFMYSIPESKRKFLIKSSVKQGGGIRPGYMPVENITELGINDERYLQYAVQRAAVNGEIAFVYKRPEYSDFLVSDRCVFPSSNNTIVSNTVSGGFTAALYSQHLVPVPGYYNDMVLSIDSGQGTGLRRVIENYEPTGLNTGIVTISTSKTGFVPGLLQSTSRFSIVPNIYIEGDGGATSANALAYRNLALVNAKFASVPSSATGNSPRKLNSFEMIDSGFNYTRATLKIVKGLTFSDSMPSDLAIDISETGLPIISPQGGHGSNPVAELGGKAIMIVKKFTGSEGGKVTTENEFRQFGLIKNPLLTSPQYRITTIQPGASDSFTVGATAYAGTTAATTFAGSGKVVSWYPGITGFTASSELVLTNVSGTISASLNHRIGSSPTGNSFIVNDVEQKTIAGSEGRDLLVLTVTPTMASTFSQMTNDFPRGLNAVGLGNPTRNVPFTGSSGKIYRWDPDAGVNSKGRIFLENAYGDFLSSELVGVRDRYLNFVYGMTGIGRVVEKDTVVEGIPNVYSQIHEYELGAAFGDEFTDATFQNDDIVTGYSLTGSGQNLSVVGTGRVMSWTTSGSTGSLSLLVTSGKFGVNDIIPYATPNLNTVSSVIYNVLRVPDLQYRSGIVQYIQNMRPIVRSETQEEEIKLIIEI